MISMKFLKIFLLILMLQVSMHTHANDDFLADIVKGVLGAKLLQGIAQEIGNNDSNEQESNSNNNNSSSQQGSLGYQYYLIGQKECKKGEYLKALKWFKESKHQGYAWADRAIDSANVNCVDRSYVDNSNSDTNKSASNFKAKARYSGYGDDGITIKAPKVVENAAVVPVTAVFNNRVNTKDKIKLYVNGKLAFQANPKKGSYIDQISTRVRLKKKDNRIKVKVIRADGSIETKTSKTIYTDNPSKIPGYFDSSKKSKFKEKNGDIKMLFKNKMGTGKHIWKIKLTSNSGEVFIKLSPLLSKNPYIKIKGNHSDAKLVKTFYGNCNKDYSNSSKEPACLFEQEKWYATLNEDKKPLSFSKNKTTSFSDLWGQYGGSVLDSSTNKSSNNGSDTSPPVIHLNHSDAMMTSSKSVEISGIVSDSSKVAELLVKGEKVAIDEKGNFNISQYVRLGRNVFDIVALDSFGNKTSKVVTITRNKDVAKNLDKPLDLPSFKGRKDKNAVALIIGLDQYESIARAPWAESDASVFFDYAQQSLGIPADRIALITGDKSDRSGIYDSLDMWLPTMVEKGDSNVYVYFAGHGLATADGEQAYLIPYDGNLENLRRTAIPRKEVISVLKDLKAKSVTLFMDTCYSGTPKGGKGTLVADSRGLRIVKKDNFSSLPKNFTIFSAASNRQTASSHPNLENGLFSYWMMRGLGGEADNNNDRKITNGELHKFINKNVKKAAALMGRKQNSQLTGDADRVIVSW